MSSRIAELVSQMTLAEKAAMCTGASPWRTLDIERLGLATMVVTDGPHGLRRVEDIEVFVADSLPATAFPVAVALAATWNKALLYEMGEALAVESIALATDVILGPGINIKRSPLCGRNFEYFSEDPLVSGELSAALINGIQSKGVGTSLKHFAVNNQETRRYSVNAVVDERTLHEIYLHGFEIAVKQAQPWTIMCAYNSVNGDFCAQNEYLLTEVLRNQWHYDGFVMSDWGAVKDLVASVKAGLDLEMPGPSPYRTQDLIEAVQNGELDEAVLDRAVARLLNIIFRAQATPKGHTQIDIDGHHALARRIAGEGIVLLKNDNNLLPLKGGETLAVIGNSALEPVFQGGGSSFIHNTRLDIPLDLLKERAEVRYVVGDTSFEIDEAAIADSVAVAQEADVALLFIALPASIESEGYDRKHLDLAPQQIALIKAVAQVNPRTVVILNNGSAIDMRVWLDDVDAVLETWLPGQAGAGALVDILYGEINPSGKLTETFPLKLTDVPAHLSFPGNENEVRYGEGIYVGYRGYDEMHREVLFPFGFGLSYTQFAYSNLQVSTTQFNYDDVLELTLDVTNTGPVAGQEVVQLYIHDVASHLKRPPKELKAFAKVALEPGETKQVKLNLAERAFSYYNPTRHQWLSESGEFDILIGSSSADIHLTQRIELINGTPLDLNLSGSSLVSEWLQHPRGLEFIEPFLIAMYGENYAQPKYGMDIMEFAGELPLTTLIGFCGIELEKSPQDMVKDILAEL